MAKQHWKEKRAQQGYSYQDVFLEIKRRFEGERTLDEDEARRRFEDGVEKLDSAFRFSAHLCDLLVSKMLTYKDLQYMAGIRDENRLLLVLLDPISRGKDTRHSLRDNREVDRFYPGDDLPTKK